MRPVAQRMTMHPSETTLLTRIPTGPYPGWQPLEHGPRIQKPKKKESVGLTRLSPIHNISHQQPMTPSCRCIPPWATGLSADRTVRQLPKNSFWCVLDGHREKDCDRIHREFS